MEILVMGLVVFFGIHLVPAAPALHGNLQARMGVMGWKGFMALIAVAGFVLIVIGWQRSAFVPVYTPPAFGAWMPRILMLPALFLLVAAYVPSNIRRFTRHPMLWGTVLWAGAHLFANGDLRSILLFGTFLAWSLFDMWSANRRGTRRVDQRIPWFYEVLVVGVGVLAYGLLARFHGTLFGMPVMPG